MNASPMETVKGLWGGELPAFDSIDAVNELLHVLVAGLWNRLTEHQSSRHPFRLLRFEVEATRDGLKQLALASRGWCAARARRCSPALGFRQPDPPKARTALQRR